MKCALQGCQLSSTGGVWGLGTLASTNITATYMPDDGWALTVLYSNPAQGMRFTVYYTLESPGSEPVFEFVTEITPSTIVRAVVQHLNLLFAVSHLGTSASDTAVAIA